MRALAKKFLTACVAGALLLVSSGCGGSSSSSAPTGKAGETASAPANGQTGEQGGPIEITDVTGNKVKLEKPLEKALIQYSGSGGPILTMAALDRDNYTSKIAAMDDGLEKNRKDLWDLLVAANPELQDIPKIGDVGKDEVSAEELLTMGVDGIIVPVRLKAKMDPLAQKAGLPVLYIDYHGQKLDTHLESTEIIAKATGLTKNLDAVNGFYQDVVGGIESRAAGLDRSISTYLEIGFGGPEEYGNTYGSEMMWGAILEAVGAKNIATDFLKPDEATPITPEQVLVSNPDRIIIAGSTWEDQPTSVKIGFSVSKEEAIASLAPYQDREGWDKLTAIQNGELYAIGHPLTRDMLDFYSYAVLAKLFHPQEFADLDPDALMQEYFERFMPIDFQGTWFVKYE